MPSKPPFIERFAKPLVKAWTGQDLPSLGPRRRRVYRVFEWCFGIGGIGVFLAIFPETERINEVGGIIAVPCIVIGMLSIVVGMTIQDDPPVD